MLSDAATLRAKSSRPTRSLRGDAGRVTVSEFTFLALGLVLGLASGIALVEVIRARPPARREVHVTVAQDAIPRRRPATLSDDAFIVVGPEPARGGPADRREIDLPMTPPGTDRRTHVQSHGPGRLAGEPTPGSPGMAVPVVPDAEPVFRIQGLESTRRSGPRAALVGFTIRPGEDPVLAELRASIVVGRCRQAGSGATRDGRGSPRARPPGRRGRASRRSGATGRSGAATRRDRTMRRGAADRRRTV